MRKKFWVLLVFVVIGAVVLSVIGIKRLRAWSAERKEGQLPKDQMITTDIAPRPALVSEDGNPVAVPPEAVSQYMLTTEYAGLSSNEKREFHDQIVEAYSSPYMRPIPLEAALNADESLTEEQRAYLLKEAGPIAERVEARRAERFFELSVTEQNQIFDMIIGAIEIRRLARRNRDDQGRHDDDATATSYPTDYLRAMAMQPSVTRAMHQEFFRRLNNRMKELGVEPLGRR